MRTKILFGISAPLIIGFMAWLFMFSSVFNSSIGPLKNLYPGDMSNIDKILVRNGGTGEETIVTEKNKIEKWVAKAENVKFILDRNQEPRTGYGYAVVLFEKDKQIYTFSTNSINGKYFTNIREVYELTEELLN
jgi:hypothetical protein